MTTVTSRTIVEFTRVVSLDGRTTSVGLVAVGLLVVLLFEHELLRVAGVAGDRLRILTAFAGPLVVVVGVVVAARFAGLS